MPGSEPFLDQLLGAPENAERNEKLEQPAPPVVPEKLTRKQIGQLRRQYFTLVHGTVRSCGHKAKFRKDHDPSNNCASCWAAYFVTCVDLDFIHTVLTTKGAKALVAIRGTKFTKMFHGFLSSQLLHGLLSSQLPAPAAETNNQPTEAPAQIVGGTFGNGTAGNEVQADSSAQQAIG